MVAGGTKCRPKDLSQGREIDLTGRLWLKRFNWVNIGLAGGLCINFIGKMEFWLSGLSGCFLGFSGTLLQATRAHEVPRVLRIANQSIRKPSPHWNSLKTGLKLSFKSN